MPLKYEIFWLLILNWWFDMKIYRIYNWNISDKKVSIKNGIEKPPFIWKFSPRFFTFFACFVKRWQWCDKTNTYWGLYTGCYWNFIHVHQFIGLHFTITLDLKHSSKICSSPQTYYLALSLNFIVLTPFPLKTNIPQMKNLWKRENYKISPRNKRS